MLFSILFCSSVCLRLRYTASSLSWTSITFCGSGPGARAGVGPVHTLIRHSCPAAAPWTSLLLLFGAFSSPLLHRRSGFQGTSSPARRHRLQGISEARRHISDWSGQSKTMRPLATAEPSSTDWLSAVTGGRTMELCTSSLKQWNPQTLT